MNSTLQVIALNVPWPADYGGVIDIYYRLKALQEAGIKTELHCFTYNRPAAAELESICSKVFYYPRKTSFLHALTKEPYITASRSNKQLTKNINATSGPVLMEGIHCTDMLYKNEIDPARCFIRIHNIEHNYYRHLAVAESNPLRKLYYTNAARKLEKFESIYSLAAGLACISETERSYYGKKYSDKAFHLPASHPYDKVSSLPGKGEYVLYHGNLGIAENHQAAMFLLKEVAAYGEFPLILAGKSPRRSLVLEAYKHPGARIFADPDSTQMEQLLQQAHVHVLPTFQETGVKLKLISSLYQGRFVVTNPAMTNGTGLDALCHIATDGTTFREKIKQLMQQPFGEREFGVRSTVLENLFSNQRSAETLLKKMGII